MTLDDILSASELHYVMEDIKNFPTSFIENSVPVQQLPDVSGSHQAYDSDVSDYKPHSGKRKRMKRMCDSTLGSSGMTETLPCLEPYPGILNFQLHLPTDNSAHKWTYSKVLGKVFIDIDKVLALQFRWNFVEHKTDGELFVRAMPVYTSHDSLNVPVTRCPIHLLPDNPLNQGFHFVEHVMRCEHSSTLYEQDTVTKRLSCRSPLNRPQPGSETTTLTYKFVCKTSCLSGMNRKPISVIFTLENENHVEYGRQRLAVKICSCPKRDKAKEEKNELEKSESSHTFSESETTPTISCVKNLNVRNDMNSTEPLRDIKNLEYTSKWKDRDDGVLEAISDLKKLIENMNQKGSVFTNFAKYIEAELLDMSPEDSSEAQNEIQKIIVGWKRKRQSV